MPKTELVMALKAFLIFSPSSSHDDDVNVSENKSLSSSSSSKVREIISGCDNLKCSYELIEKENKKRQSL